MSLSSILQWNIRGLRGNAEELKVLLSEHDPGIFCLQETMLNSISYNVGMNYKFYGSIPEANNINRARGGSAIVIKSNVSHDYIPLDTTLQAVAVRVVLKKRYTICSLYLDPSSEVSYAYNLLY